MTRGSRSRLLGDRGEVGGGRREDQLVAVEVAVGEDPFDHRLRRAAAVIADAVEAHGVAERRVGALDGDPDLAGEVGEVGDVAGDDAEGDDLAAADALPDEGVGGQRHLVLLGPAEDVGGVAVAGEDVGQRRGVAEAVDVVADARRDAEAVAEVALAVLDLAVEAGGGGQVEVGLDELAAGDVPLAALDQGADAGEEVGAQPLDLGVEPGLAAGEDELRVLVAAVGHRGGGGERLVGAGLPAPEPHRVDVGIRDHVDAHRRPSALHRAGHQRADDEALQDEEDDDRRHDREHARRGEDLGRGLVVGALEIEDADRDRQQARLARAG